MRFCGGAAPEDPMAKRQILVVEDEADIAELIRFQLEKAGFGVTCVRSGERALEAVGRQPPDLVLLDLMLPGMDGLSVCRRLKTAPATRTVPVIMVTARGDERDVVQGLDAGADDYVVKPFSPAVLVARVEAALRRQGASAGDRDTPLTVRGIVIHPGRHEVKVNGQPVRLTRTEFMILHLLARRPGWVFTRSQIVGEVRGKSDVVTDRSVDVQIVSLRRKLGGSGALIETVRGVGYRMRG
jgi:two-component system alkaline phosphatase synthesis response regulator PhoP